MIKKRITNLIVFLLCAILLLPISFNLQNVKADEAASVVAYTGVNFTFYTSSDIEAKGNKVKIVATDSEEAQKELYVDGSIKSDVAPYIFESFTKGKVTARIAKAGEYTFSITSTENAEISFTQKVVVKTDINSADFADPKYEFDGQKLADYQALVEKASYQETAEGEEAKSLFIGSTYNVPSLETLINCGSFAYNLYKRTLFYAEPSSASYASSTATGSTASTISINKVGTYRFYMIINLDEIDGREFKISTDHLQEFVDGFYQMKKADSDELVYAMVSGDNYVYFEDKDRTKEYEGEVEKGELLVPIFEFTILNAGPQIERTASYQENGYVGLSYSIKSIKVTGNNVQTTYTLKYRADDASEWVDAEEEFDSTNKTFIPKKIGRYKVVVTAVDDDGKTATPVETAEIVVLEEMYSPDYVVSFGDWLEVNLVPFIFLCISGLSLIGIILLLVIKPKN